MHAHLNHSCFPGLTTARFLQVASAAEADGVDLNVLLHAEPPEVIAAAVRSTRMRVSAIHALMDWALPSDPDPHFALAPLLEAAEAAGAPLIICVAPLSMGGFPPDLDIVASAAERLRGMAAMARPRGIQLGLEQVGRSSSRPGAMSGIRRLGEALAIARAAADDVVLVADSYNLATSGDPFEVLSTVPSARLGIAHLADGDLARGVRLPAGEGDIDLAAFVRALAGAGYRGPLSLEIFPPAPWPDPLDFAQQALSTMRDYIARAEAG